MSEYSMHIPDDDLEDPRVRALEEGAGYSHADAEEKVFGHHATRPTGGAGGSMSSLESKVSKRVHSPRADGDSELDPHWNPEYDFPSHEEAKERSDISRRGHALATETIRETRRNAIIKDPNLTDEEKIHELARLQLEEVARQQRRGIK